MEWAVTFEFLCVTTLLSPDIEMSECDRIASNPIELGELTELEDVDLVNAFIYFCCNVYNNFNSPLNIKGPIPGVL